MYYNIKLFYNIKFAFQIHVKFMGLHSPDKNELIELKL